MLTFLWKLLIVGFGPPCNHDWHILKEETVPSQIDRGSVSPVDRLLGRGGKCGGGLVKELVDRESEMMVETHILILACSRCGEQWDATKRV